MKHVIEGLQAIHSEIEDPALKSIKIYSLNLLRCVSKNNTHEINVTLEASSITIGLKYYRVQYEFKNNCLTNKMLKYIRSSGFEFRYSSWHQRPLYQINYSNVLKEDLMSISRIFLRNNTNIISTMSKSRSKLVKRLFYKSWNYL